MEEMYLKPENRKPWQKNRVLAIMVLLLLYFIEFIQYIPVRLSMIFTSHGHKPARPNN